MTKELLVADVLAPAPSVKRMVGRALLRHCPRCGSGGQFHHWLHRADHCPGCGYALERQSDFFFGAYLLNLAVTLISLFSLLIVSVLFEAAQQTPPLVPIIAAGLFCAVILPLICYPYSFTMWAVIDLRTDPLKLREIANAVDKLDADRSEAEKTAEHSHC